MISNTHSITSTQSRILTQSDSARTIYFHVTGNSTVYLGGSNVTTANGLATEKHTAPLTFVIPADEELWAIVASGTVDVRMMYALSKSGNV